MKIVSATAFNRLKATVSHQFDFLDSMIGLQKYCPAIPLSFSQKRLVIIISGDRGLCGGYNHKIRQAALSFLEKFPESDVGYIGAKGVLKNKEGIFKETAQILKRWVNLVDLMAPLWPQYDKVYVVYTKFQSLYEQHVVVEEIGQFQDISDMHTDIINETSINILPLIYTAQVMKTLMNAQLCEFSSRMLSMDNATQNADKMITTLQKTSNKLRQASITKELSETVAGSSAIKL